MVAEPATRLLQIFGRISKDPYPSPSSRPFSREQMFRDCRSARGEDRAFEDDGEATIWFEPVDSDKQESADEDNRGNIKNS